MTKAFISYHHALDQDYKDALSLIAEQSGAFEDTSVEIGDIDENLSSQEIRQIIRDEYLRDSEVTILLCGAETRYRKHVDWELKSSMIDGKINKKSGILVINLPSANAKGWHAALPGEKEIIYPDYNGTWTTFTTSAQYEERYPMMPSRIIDNLVKSDVSISVVNWERVYNNPRNLKFLVDKSAEAGKSNKYDLTQKMRRQNYNP